MATVHRIPAGLTDGHGGSLFPIGWWFGPDSLRSLLPLSRRLWGASLPAGRLRKQQQGLVHAAVGQVSSQLVFFLCKCLISTFWTVWLGTTGAWYAICIVVGTTRLVLYLFIRLTKKSLELMSYSFLGNSCCRMFSSKYGFIHYLNEQI